MARVLIVYTSENGNTRSAAQAVAGGAADVPTVEAVLRDCEEVTVEDLLASDGVLLGSPVHMGSMSWRLKKLIDTVCSGIWIFDGLAGKVGGVFTTCGGYGNSGGGGELAQLSMLANLAELGMILVPLPKGTAGYERNGLHWGPNGRTAGEGMEPTPLSEPALEIFRRHGAHVARVAVALAGKKIFG